MKLLHKFALVLVALGLLGCPKKGPLPPLAPVTPTPTATSTPTPVCGFTALGAGPCGASSPGLIIIRSQAQWDVFAAAATCAAPLSSPVTNFTSQMVLIYTIVAGAVDCRTSGTFSSACLGWDRLDVQFTQFYNYALGCPAVLGPCLCQNQMVAVPQTGLPLYLNFCLKEYGILPGGTTTCSTTIY